MLRRRLQLALSTLLATVTLSAIAFACFRWAMLYQAVKQANVNLINAVAKSETGSGSAVDICAASEERMRAELQLPFVNRSAVRAEHLAQVTRQLRRLEELSTSGYFDGDVRPDLEQVRPIVDRAYREWEEEYLADD